MLKDTFNPELQQAASHQSRWVDWQTLTPDERQKKN